MAGEDWSAIEGYEPAKSVPLKWSELKPFKFFMRVKGVEAGKYEDYLIRGVAMIRAKDKVEEPPFPVGEETQVSFFTKTVLRTRFQHLFGDNWSQDMIGKLLYIDFAGLVESNQGRTMYSFFISETGPKTEKQVNLPDEGAAAQ